MTGPESADGRQHLHGWPIRDYDHLIAVLANSRRSRRITLDQVAERMQDVGSGVSHTLTGAREARGGRLFRLADALGYRLALVPRERCDHPQGTGTICDTCGTDVAAMAPERALSATLAAEQPSAQGVDGSGPETGTAGATDERAREDT